MLVEKDYAYCEMFLFIKKITRYKEVQGGYLYSNNYGKQILFLW